MNVDEFVATFDFLDKNGDGNLTKDETTRLVAEGLVPGGAGAVAAMQ